MEPNNLLIEFLVHSCLYYEFGVSEIPDCEFDWIAHRLCDQWDKVTHPHKTLVDIKSLRQCVSGFYLVFPSIVRSCAARKACKIPGSALHNRARIFGEEHAYNWWTTNVLAPDIRKSYEQTHLKI